MGNGMGNGVSQKGISGGVIAASVIALGGIGVGAYLLLKKTGTGGGGGDGPITDPGPGTDIPEKILDDYFDVEEKVNKLREIIGRLEDDLSQLKTLIAEQDGIIAGLISSIAIIQDLLGQQGESIDSMLVSIAAIDSALAILAEEEAKLREKLGNEYPELDAIERQINTIQEEVEKLRIELAKITQQRDELQKEVERMAQELALLEENLKKMSELVTKMEQDLAEAKKEIEDLLYQLEPVDFETKAEIVHASSGKPPRRSVAAPFFVAIQQSVQLDIYLYDKSWGGEPRVTLYKHSQGNMTAINHWILTGVFGRGNRSQTVQPSLSLEPGWYTLEGYRKAGMGGESDSPWTIKMSAKLKVPRFLTQ